MTKEWQKAREAAIKKALDCGQWIYDDTTMEVMGRYLDTALSTIREHGFILVPREPTERQVMRAGFEVIDFGGEYGD